MTQPPRPGRQLFPMLQPMVSIGSNGRVILGHLLLSISGNTLQMVPQRMKMALIGPRHHQWMYDGRSLCRLLEQNGFSHAASTPAGATRIAVPGKLDLREREEESIYVEAVSQ